MIDEWRIEIEESERLIPKGILCMVRSDGSKLYVRPVAYKGGFLELKPLSAKELADLKIEVQESCINSEFDIDVEESESEPEKKSKPFNLNDPSDMEKAKRLAEEALARLKKEDPEKWNLENKNSDEIQAENEDLKAKLELIASRELEKRMDSLGIHDEAARAKIRENPARITGFEMAKAQYYPQNNEVPSGVAPLNDFQIKGSNAKTGFDSLEQMIDFLHANPTPENQIILKQLWEKTLHGTKSSRNFETRYPEEDPIRSNATEITKSIFDPKDPNIKSDVERYNEALRKHKKKGEQ